MKYMGDIVEDSTIRGSFNTRDTDGVPITLAGSPAISVYKDASTTESTAGITLTVDFDSRTGHHVWTIDTSADAFYATGSDYRVVLTAGTVDSISVVGVEVGCFSIQNRYVQPTLDAAGIRSAVGLSTANLDTQLSTIDTVVDSILVDTAVIGAAGAGLTAIPWNASWDAEVQSECTDALNAYDPPTRTELTTDTNSILTAVGDVPTNAELTTALASADDAVLAAVGTVDTVVDAIKVKTDQLNFTIAGQVDANALSGGAGGGLDAAGVRAAIGLASANLDTQLSTIDTVVDTILVDTAVIGAPVGASISADIAAVKTQTAAIEVDTQDLQVQIGIDGAGLTALPWNAAWDAEVQSECADALTAYDPPTRTELTTDINSVLTAIGDVPTNAELATALASADDAVLSAVAIVDSVVDDIKLVTDQFVFTIAGQVDANALSSVGLSAADVRAAVGLASANLDTQLSTIDTVVDTILVDTSTTLQAELDGIQADTEDIQSRLPAALVSGRIDASVGAIASNTITAASIASDAITEIQFGLATSSTVSDILADTNELQTDWVNGGRLDLILDSRSSQSSVDVIDGIVDSILVDTSTTLQAELDGIQADTEDIQSRLPASLMSGRINASVGAFENNSITAASLATDAVNEIADGILLRNVSNVESTAGEHTLATVILATLEWEISGNDLIIKRTDGTTVHYTKTLSSSIGTGDVITGLN